jgi:hypothetical protein
MAKFKVKIKNSVLKSLDKSAVMALEQTAEAVKTDVIQAQVIPFDSGALQNESTFIDTSKSSQGKASIIADTPYARKIYFHPEFNFQTINNPNARGEWFEDWIDGTKRDFAKKVFITRYKKLTGV